MNKQLSTLLIGLVAGGLCVGYLHYQGYGKRLHIEHEEVPCTASHCWEGIMHFTYLYDGPRKIVQVGDASISPSGTYVAFEGATLEDNGKILLYNRSSGQTTDITEGGFALPETFLWDEPHSKLTITYYQENPDPIYAKHPPSVIRLP